MNNARFSWILVVGDLLVLLVFVAIGRSSHALSMADLTAGLMTALPFVAGWFAVAPWLGLYNPNINRSMKQLLPRLAATWIIAVPLGHVLRALLLGRSIPAGIPFTFVLVSLGFIGVAMLLWRAGYTWWQQRQVSEAAL
jgi:FlaA1/EpsC-like NDP-sugar epimerase